MLSPGQTHEMKLAYELLGGIADANVMGDRAYDARPLVAEIASMKITDRFLGIVVTRVQSLVATGPGAGFPGVYHVRPGADSVVLSIAPIQLIDAGRWVSFPEW